MRGFDMGRREIRDEENNRNSNLVKVVVMPCFS